MTPPNTKKISAVSHYPISGLYFFSQQAAFWILSIRAGKLSL
jgi:hypothetical protein